MSTIFASASFRVTLLCALVAILDGFDTQVIAYVAPAIGEAWDIPATRFGPVFSAGPVGLAAGALFLAPLSDRIGRKASIVASTALFGFFAVLTAYTQTIDQLLLVRFLTGVGLGAAMPNIIALTGEFAPSKWRATLITLMFSGLPLGSTMAGFVANWLIADHGWQAVFLVGGILPLLLAPFLLWLLPQSPEGPTQRGRSTDSAPGPDGQQAHRPPASNFPVRQLFHEGRAPVTLLLWLTYFANLLAMYFLVNWLPTLLHAAGLPLDRAILSTATLNLGGALGGIAIGLLIDRYRPTTVLRWGFAVSVLAIAGLALAGHDLLLLLGAAGLAGFTIVGAQTGCHVLTSSAYPTAIRATGLGWALGIGRLGAIAGPLFGGALLAALWSPRDIILAASVPIIIAFCAVWMLGRFVEPRPPRPL